MVTFRQLIQPQDSVPADGRGFFQCPEIGIGFRGLAAPNRDDAWWMARIAQLAYVRDEGTIRRCLEDTNLSFVGGAVRAAPDTLGTQFLVLEGRSPEAGKVAVLAYRGTQPDELLDMLVDGNAKRHDLGGGAWVHAGFHDAFRQTRPMVDDLLRQAGGETLWITGHSLGGALAAIAAAHYARARVYTFGQPHVGNRAFTGSIRSDLFARVENRSDGVAAILGLLRSYEKAGAPYWFDDGRALQPAEGRIAADSADPADVARDVRELTALAVQLSLREVGAANIVARLANVAGDLLSALFRRGRDDLVGAEETEDWARGIRDLVGLARQRAFATPDAILQLLAAGLPAPPSLDSEVRTPVFADHAMSEYLTAIAGSPANWPRSPAA